MSLVVNIDHKIILVLNSHPKIGSQTLKKILAAFEDPSRIWSSSRHDLTAKLGEKLANLTLESIQKFNPDDEIKRLTKYDVGYITIYDKEYPKLLKEIYDAPAILYVKGNIDALNCPSLGVVGSRKYSQYGASVGYKLSKECAMSGLTIISGLALGIDAIAHRAAIDAGGVTVGVLGCGLDQVYPVSNHNLGKEIIAKAGAIISEFPIGTPPMKQNFPTRNRIIAGLSLGTLVVEAAFDSGSLITAGLALEYNREVFSVPGNIDSQMSEGTNKLIKEGAIPVTETGDILKILNIEEKTNIVKAKQILPETKEEGIIVELLKTGEKSGDELIEKSKLNVIELNSLLTMMELKGIVKNIGGGRYKLG